MAKPSGILDKSPEEIIEPLTEDQKVEIQESKDKLDWTAKTEEEIAAESKATEDKKAEDDRIAGEKKSDEEKQQEEKAEADEKAETERLTAKAEELKKTVDEVKEIEANEKTQEDERIVKLAEEQGKTVEEIIEVETAAKDEKTDEQKETERLNAIAKEDGVTVEEVKANEEKDSKVVENYSKDPMKIAKALRNETSAYGKLKAENEKLTEYKTQVETQRLKYNEKMIDAQLEKNREKIVEEYIKIKSDESEEDEGVLFERAKVRIKDALKANNEKVQTDLENTATESRVTLADSIPEEYKEYTSEIKEVLEAHSAQEVTSKDFDIVNLCYWARGKKMTPEYVKSLEDAAEKRGKEQPEIIERKTGATSTSTRSTQTKTKTNIVETASVQDKERALEVFSSKDDWTDDKKIEEYMTNRKQHDNWD